MEFEIFGSLSLLIFLAAIIYSAYVRRQRGKAKRLFSPLNLFTIGTFLSLVCLFIPIYYAWDEWKDDYAFLRPLLLAVHSALRIFILDGDFSTIEKFTPNDSAAFKVLFSLYAAVLFVVAPVLTFTTVLSLFKNLKSELRLRFCRRKPLYILSELNPRSVAMAESIAARPGDAMIVFTDVFEQNEESDYELLMKVRDMNAICLKKDVTNISLQKKTQPIEIFLIGENETENVEQAIKLTESCRESKQKISIYVFAASASADHIIDSLNQGSHTLNEGFRESICSSPQALLLKGVPEGQAIDGAFSIRRIDRIDQLVMNVLEDEATCAAIFDAARETKTVSISILGMGSYGTQFLKAAVWFYQRYGYRVEFNIFDLAQENGDIQKRLAQECPELISKKPPFAEGDAWHDIRFFTGIDCFTSDFDTLVLESQRQRLKKTQLVFIALGDDDKDIEAAMMIRKLFTQLDLNRTKLPLIYSIVYDDRKATNLSGKEGTGLRDHKGKPYHIHFVGTLSSQYSYSVIEKNRQTEQEAFLYHVQWVRKSAELRHYYRTIAPFRQRVDSECSEISWDDAYLFPRKADGSADFDAPINTGGIVDLAKLYVTSSYCRYSSKAKAAHKKMIDRFCLSTHHHSSICGCRICSERRITEHMRWNAYMRSLGYKYHEERNDLAKHHPDLIPWSELPYLEKFKD